MRERFVLRNSVCKVLKNAMTMGTLEKITCSTSEISVTSHYSLNYFRGYGFMLLDLEIAEISEKCLNYVLKWKKVTTHGKFKRVDSMIECYELNDNWTEIVGILHSKIKKMEHDVNGMPQFEIITTKKSRKFT